MTDIACMAKDDHSNSVSSGLNLWLALEDPEKMGELLANLLAENDAIATALTELHYVHFARFVPTPCRTALQVITSFDGEFDAYVMDFVLAIGDQFEMILRYVKDRPPSPVKDHPAEFLNFICKQNLSYEGDGGGGIGMYSAYGQRTVIDIVGAGGVAPAFTDPPPVAVDRGDVQANVLRGVSSKFSWYGALRIRAADGARAFLEKLLAGHAEIPPITSDALCSKEGRPSIVLTLGFTFGGLQAMGIEKGDQRAFRLGHKAFVRGPTDASAADANGDIGDSDPSLWELGGADPVDMVVMIHSDDKKALSDACNAVRGLAEQQHLTLVAERQAEVLVDPKDASRRLVHFGYAEGVSHPRLSSDDVASHPPDLQPKAAVGGFLLGAGYPNIYGGSNSLGGISSDLGQNGTFAALRILKQDVAAFEAVLCTESTKHSVDKEWLAAKLMGRWRDGTPVSLSPDSRSNPEDATRNDFDFRPSGNHPDTPDDSGGARCPLGAHIRRMNPRSATVAGRAHSRRLLRRGMPYGPAFNPQVPDEYERGLVGLFICADLDRQFEFILRQWANGDRATTGMLGQQDPIIGAQETLHIRQSIKAEYRIPRAGLADLVLTLPRLVTTVGSAYLFMPGFGGLRYLATDRAEKAPPAFRTAPFSLQSKNWQAAATGVEDPAPDPTTFDPRETSFRAKPFETCEWFRKNHPVVKLPSMNSTWVFSHEHVKEVGLDLDRFRKRKSTDTTNAGFLNMDRDDRHTACRNEAQPLFDKVLAATQSAIPALVAKAYAGCCNQAQVRALDWIEQFAKPIAQGAFFDLLGLELGSCADLIKHIDISLKLATPADDQAQRDQFDAELRMTAFHLVSTLQKSARSNRLYDLIQHQMTGPHDEKHNQPHWPLPALEVEQTVNTVTLAMAGFLPLQWFIAIATWQLLKDDETLLKQIKADATISNTDVVNELLRFDMSAPLSDRYVVADTTLGGISLKADDRITLSFSSANHDPKVFGLDADQINFKREIKGPGFAFGPENEHICMGKEMVYRIMEPVIQTLRTAYPAPRLENNFKPSWGVFNQHAMFRAMATLKVHC